MYQGVSRLALVISASCAPVIASVVVLPACFVPAKEAGKAAALAGKVGFGFGVGEFSGALPGISPVEKHVACVCTDVDIIMGYCSIETHVENIDTDLAKLEYFRTFINVERLLSQEISLFGGVGYGHQANLIDIKGDFLKFGGAELLVDLGAKFDRYPYTGTLRYTHCLDRSYKAVFKSDVQKFSETNIGSVEAKLYYHFNQYLSSSISVEAQLTSNTAIERKYLLIFGLNCAL